MGRALLTSGRAVLTPDQAVLTPDRTLLTSGHEAIPDDEFLRDGETLSKMVAALALGERENEYGACEYGVRV